jgi:hypothetical protein
VKRSGATRFSEEWLLEVDSPIALSAWYLDDGSLSKKRDRTRAMVYGHHLTISTGNASCEEVGMVSRWMSRVWGIDVKSYHQTRMIGGNAHLETSISLFKSADIDAFLEIVRPIALKVGLGYKVTRDYTYTTSQ